VDTWRSHRTKRRLAIEAWLQLWYVSVSRELAYTKLFENVWCTGGYPRLKSILDVIVIDICLIILIVIL